MLGVEGQKTLSSSLGFSSATTIALVYTANIRRNFEKHIFFVRLTQLLKLTEEATVLILSIINVFHCSLDSLFCQKVLAQWVTMRILQCLSLVKEGEKHQVINVCLLDSDRQSQTLQCTVQCKGSDSSTTEATFASFS